MKKFLLLLVLAGLCVPAMAEVNTTTTKEFVPFTEAIDRAKLQQEADIRAGKQTLEQQREVVQTKINEKKQAYEEQQAKQAQKRAEMKKQNEAKKQEIKDAVDSTKQNIQTIKRNVIETPEQIRKNNALDFTNLKKSVSE